MANEEIIQQFKVVDSGATAALSKVDAKIQEVKNHTNELSDSHKKHGKGIDDVGKQLLGLGERHASARHSLMLFSEATGVARGGLMTMAHSMGMLGPAAGAALGGFILLKEGLEAQAEEAAKAREKYDQLREAWLKFQEVRKEKAEVLEFGEEGAQSNKEQLAADAVKHAAQRQLNELENERSTDYNKKSVLGKGMEHASFFIDQMKSFFSGESEDEYNARIANEKENLKGQIGRASAGENVSDKDKQQHKKWMEITKETQQDMNKLEIQNAYAKGENLEIIEKQVEALHKQVQEHKEIAKHEKDAVILAAMKKQIQSEEMALAQKYNERDEKYHQRGAQLRELGRPGAFSSAYEKAKYAENEKFQNEMDKMESRPLSDQKKLKEKHEESLAKIELDRKDELMTRSAEIDAQKLRNEGKNFEAEKTLLEAHFRELGDKHKGDVEQQKMDEAAYNAQLEKLTIEHNNEEAQFTANNRAEMLRLKGDSYEAERVQLDEWLREEKEKHVGHEEELKALYDKRKGDIDRREKEARVETLAGYNIQLQSALHGHGVGSVLTMQEEHRKKLEEIKNSAHPEDAKLENQAYKARIDRMKHESDLEMQSKKTVGFMDLSSGWESFAAALNKSPKEQEQLAEAKETNQLLGRIESALSKSADATMVQ